MKIVIINKIIMYKNVQNATIFIPYVDSNAESLATSNGTIKACA